MGKAGVLGFRSPVTYSTDKQVDILQQYLSAGSSDDHKERERERDVECVRVRRALPHTRT